MITCFASKDGLAFMLALAYATEVLLVGYLSASGLLPDCGISDETLLVWTLGFIVFQLVLSGWLSLWAERQTEFYISQLNLLYQTSKKASQAKGIFLATMRCVWALAAIWRQTAGAVRERYCVQASSALIATH